MIVYLLRDERPAKAKEFIWCQIACQWKSEVCSLLSYLVGCLNFSDTDRDRKWLHCVVMRTRCHRPVERPVSVLGETAVRDLNGSCACASITIF
jgi:hypothetical protein